jgi:hypothetical protein
MLPKFRFRKFSLRGNRSNLALFNEIAAHLSGASQGLAMTRGASGFLFYIGIWGQDPP